MLFHLRTTIAAAALLCATPALAGDAITLAISAPSPGTNVEESGDLQVEMKVAVKMGPKSIEQAFSTRTIKRKTIEVLTTEKNAIVKARIVYKDHTETKTQPGSPAATTKAPFVGKTYIVEFKDGTIVVTDKNGKEAPLAEAESIRKDNRHFGKPNPFISLMPKTFTPGKPVPLSPEAAREMLGAKDVQDLKIKSATITLKKTKKVRGKNAAFFDLDLKMGGAQPPMMMSMELRGTAIISIDGGWPLEITMEGPINLTAAQEGVKGDGKAAFKSTWAYK